MTRPFVPDATFRAMVQSMSVGVMLWDEHHKLCEWNRQIDDLTQRPLYVGQTRDEVLTACEIMQTGTDHPILSHQDLRWPEPGETVRFAQFDLTRPDGERRTIEGWTTALVSEQHPSAYFVTVVLDVTGQQLARERAENESRVLEMVAADAPLTDTLETLAEIFEAQADGMQASVLLLSDDGKSVRHAAAPSLPTEWTDLVDGEPVGPDRGSCGTAAYLRQPVIVTDIATDPRWQMYREAALRFGLRACWSTPILDSSGNVLGTFAFYYSQPRKPTRRLLKLAEHAGRLATLAIERHRARHEARKRERALRDSERHLSTIYHHTADMLFHLAVEDDKYRYDSVNPAFLRAVGRTRQELIGRYVHELLPPDRYDKVTEKYRQAFASRATVRWEESSPHPSGSRHGDVTITPVFDDEGQPKSIVGAVHDVTQTHRLAQALRERVKELTLLHRVTQLVRSDRTLDANLLQEIVDLIPAGWQFPEHCVARLRWGSIEVHTARWKSTSWLLTAAFGQSRSKSPCGTVEVAYLEPVVADDQDCFLPEERELVRSLADLLDAHMVRSDLEQQLQQSQKMEAIGRLAGGIAHDFNNLLTIILNYAMMAAQAADSKSRIRADLDQVTHAAERASELTRQLLAFGRKQVLTPRVVDPHDVVASVTKMLRPLLGEDVRLLLHAAPDLGRITVDPGQLEQVVVNLAVNARDAMAQGGTLTVELSNVVLDESYASVHHEVKPGAYVVLTVSDTGTGMDSATQARIFEPFFTTKAVGQGTGLGLATVWGIVKQSNGHVWVYSEPGVGSTFRVYFPRSVQDLSLRDPAPRPDTSSPGGGTLLLVEDDDQVRTLIATILRRAGYHVLEAQNGEEAGSVSEEYLSQIDLLITDVVMPRLSGTELAQRLTAKRPDLKVLFLSGYSEAAVAQRGILSPGAGFLAKPLTPHPLLAKVRSMIVGEPAGS